jgi:hypothetical protein
MNHKPNRSFFGRPIFRFVFFLFLGGIIVSPEIRAQSEEKFYFWVTRAPEYAPQGSSAQSFVIEVNAALKAQIDEISRFRGPCRSWGGRL